MADPDYDPLGQVPAEARAAILKTLASAPMTTTTSFQINGRTVSMRKLVLWIGVIALVVWLFRIIG